ncbi:putative RNA exonuclease 4 [Blattamonas nauphoetae]|uniref:RNA exonuclease 4 n=1 Tax=Blattamonas nauphoetae TaxID=2049346 RepID=A0ABQ9XFQ1_9EUKA|nr:putative RNA exonuclease 4 [Blattamonas nauphoetae]
MTAPECDGDVVSLTPGEQADTSPKIELRPTNLPPSPSISPTSSQPIPLHPINFIIEGPPGLTRVVALDCEMVGCGPKGKTDLLARVSIVNYYGHVLLDSFVRSTIPVTDYRTHVSGIRESDMKDAPVFHAVRAQTLAILKKRIVVGHTIACDIRALNTELPPEKIRDLATCRLYQVERGRTIGLKELTETNLGIEIQRGEHSSVIDAQATMALYRLFEKEWEEKVATEHSKQTGSNSRTSVSKNKQKKRS